MQRKDFALAQFKIDAAGEFSGYGAVFGNVDQGNDIIMPGAFAKALPGFLRDGFISWSHDWTQPVAMPTAAYEDARGLFIAGRFHSTPAGQEARTVALERSAAGKRTGLSIGYDVESSAPDGQGHRLLKVINPLYEIGMVMAPMNREANVAAVKSGRGRDDMEAAFQRLLKNMANFAEVQEAETLRRLMDEIMSGRVFVASAHDRAVADAVAQARALGIPGV